MRTMARRLSLLVAFLLAPAGALAQSSADDLARAHFQSASAFYEQGRYEDAARAFMESYRLSPRPALLENVARSYERALMFDEAIAALEQLGREHADYMAEAVRQERIANLRRLQARVGGGEPDPQPAAGTNAAPPSAAASGGGGGVSIPGIAVLAAGGALGIVAIITGAVSHTMYEELTSTCPDRVCPAERQGDIDTGNALALTSTVLTFTSIAALAVGVVLLIVDSGGGGGEHARLELIPGPGEAGVAARVRW